MSGAKRSALKPQVTVARVAEQAGLSVATVSLALNDHDRVSHATRTRVKEIARELGYAPSRAARRLARNRFAEGRPSRLDEAGFLLLNPGHAELSFAYLNMLTGVEHRLSHEGALLLFARLGSGTEDPRWGRLEQSAVDGWLVAGAVEPDTIDHLHALSSPFVVMGTYHSSGPVNAVGINHAGTAGTAVRHLLELGHRRIAFVGASMTFQYQQGYLAGYRETMQKAGLGSETQQVVTHTECGGNATVTAKVDTLMAGPDLPTAIVAAEPGEAVMMHELLVQTGIRIPEDISIIGIEQEQGPPTIVGETCVVESTMAVGDAAAGLLIDILASPQRPPRQIDVGAALVEGATCAPLHSTTSVPQKN